MNDQSQLRFLILGGLWLAWIGVASTAMAESGASAGSSAGYCGVNVLRDYEKPLRGMPSIPRMGESGELPFGPRSIRLWTLSAVEDGGPVGFSLDWIRPLGEATMNWEISARFVKMSKAGLPLRGDLRRKRLTVRRMGAEILDKRVWFYVPARPAFYRVDISIEDRKGGERASYAEYFRVVERRFDVRVGLKRDVLSPGDFVVLRLENFGTVGVGYGYQYWIERHENGLWIVDPATPESFFAPLFGIGGGLSSSCEKAPLPDDMQPGRYRIAKEVGPSSGPGPERRIAKEFWVVSGDTEVP